MWGNFKNVKKKIYGCEIWTLKKRDWNRIQGAEITYLRTVKGYTKTDQLRN
jgi:hypothetical protein